MCSQGRRSAPLYQAEQHRHLLPCLQTAMSSERDPLLITPPRSNANLQNFQEAKEAEEHGPLEVSRSNRATILAGIWMANFLGVSCAMSCSTRFSKVCFQALNSVCSRPFFSLC